MDIPSDSGIEKLLADTRMRYEFQLDDAMSEREKRIDELRDAYREEEKNGMRKSSIMK